MRDLPWQVENLLLVRWMEKGWNHASWKKLSVFVWVLRNLATKPTESKFIPGYCSAHRSKEILGGTLKIGTACGVLSKPSLTFRICARTLSSIIFDF